MATPPNDDTKTLFRLLVDRQWHSYVEIRESIAKTVPPGRARRRYEQDYRHNRKTRRLHHNDPDPEPRKSLDEQIDIGQRACARAIISSWKRAGAILQRGNDNGREIRVRDGFTSWGIPGFEPQAEGDDPPFEPGGLPDLPLEVSVPSEPSSGMPDVYREPDAAADDVMHSMCTVDQHDGCLSLDSEAVAPAMLEREDARSFVKDGGGQWKPVERFEPTRRLVNAVSPEGVLTMGPDSCERCGLTVGNRALHEQWHTEQTMRDTPSDVALLNESQLRDLIRGELSMLLDTFQDGVQQYLDQQFAQVEERIEATRRGSTRWIRSDG